MAKARKPAAPAYDWQIAPPVAAFFTRIAKGERVTITKESRPHAQELVRRGLIQIDGRTAHLTPAGRFAAAEDLKRSAQRRET